MSQPSVLGRKWQILNSDPTLSILEKLLANRGVGDVDSQATYLNPELSKLHDPFLMDGMKGAVKHLQQAIKNNHRIIIFGDYDVDGVTGTAILVLGLLELGANVSYRLPSRTEDGYGLNNKIIDEMKSVDTKLLITVDTGISCAEQIKYAREQGIDVIITDHHSIPDDIPDANFILHPKLDHSGYPFPDLTGAGVAFKLIQAMFKEHFSVSELDAKLKKYIDLATLGTIADLGPLKGENRVIVKEGLKQMQNSYWDGLMHLLEVCNVDPANPIESTHVGFRIAPRINAAGRLDSPYYALKLFLTDGDTSKKFAHKLEKINKERQRLTEEILQEAETIANKQLKKEKIIIAYHPDWKSGLVGIIAGRLSSNYSMPVIIMEERNDTYIGSARGPEYFNLVEALKNCDKYLENYGGHVQAAGFTLPKANLNQFVHSMQVYAKSELAQTDTEPVLEIDTEIGYQQINQNLLDQIEKLSPFGHKNARPLFLIKGVYLKDLKKVGADRSHLLGNILVDQTEYNFIGFKMADKVKNLQEFERFDVAFHVGTNTYKGVTKIQLQLIDLKRP
ncbi:single-stranded-DNA-specific exonuclease RecJ [bacterium]|nr:single-stranded-DNA-specific exonuclease RecJ [bacterium]